MMNFVEYRIARPGIPLPPIEAPLYEYVMAANGIFIRGARREFQTQFCIAPCAIRGLEELEPSLGLHAPRVPGEIVQEMLDRARARMTKKDDPARSSFTWNSIIRKYGDAMFQIRLKHLREPNPPMIRRHRGMPALASKFTRTWTWTHGSRHWMTEMKSGFVSTRSWDTSMQHPRCV